MASASTWSAFSPTPQELAYVQLLFNVADPQKVGIITGEAAVPVLAGSELPPEKLGEIWSIADHDNNGFLTKKGVAAAVRLISWAQLGEPVTESLLTKSGGPLPTIKGVKGLNEPARVASPVPRNTTGSSTLPPFTPADRTKFLRLFANGGPAGGLLSGDKARDIFLKSRLPVDKLGQIWTLADTRNRGALDANDFAIGMHLIQACMSNPSFVIPSALPPGFYEQVSGGAPRPLEAQSTGGSIPLSPSRAGTMPMKPQYTGDRSFSIRPQTTGSSANPVHPQLTGSGRYGTSSPASSAFPSTQTSAFSNAQLPWDITSDEKAKADGFFATLDTQNRGYIEGDVAVPFMLESKLSEQVLAQIWDLADMSNDGKLTRDGFAVALHLITGKLAGKEVPSTLPTSLIPPGMRKGVAAAPVPTPQSQIQRDLWDLEDDGPLTALPTATPAKSPAFATPLSPNHTGAVAALSPANTGTPHLSSPPPVASIRRPPTRDLFEDDDNEIAAATAAQNSLAVANAKNQLESTQRSLTNAQTDRAKLEASAAESAAQLAQLESQLASAKAQYQTETKLVADLQVRQREQLANINQTRGELVTAESDLSALRAEKAEIEGSVLRDKEDIRGLQRQLKEVGDGNTAIKAEIEKIKKDARQQKGMLAIAKKQLATAEEQAEKARKEAAAEQEELAHAKEELERTHAETEALAAAAKAAPEPGVAAAVTAAIATPDPIAFPAGIPLPETPDVQSPAISTKSNNPFGRLTRQNSTASSTSSPAPFSPFGLPTAVEHGLETPNTAAAIAAPLPISADESAKTDDPFNAAFGIEEPIEVQTTPKAATKELGAAVPEHETQLPHSAAAVPVLAAALAAPIVAPHGLEPPTSSLTESPVQLSHSMEHGETPAFENVDAIEPTQAAINENDEDSSDDEEGEPEDAFGAKPHQPVDRVSPSAANNNDVFGDSPFSPSAPFDKPAEASVVPEVAAHGAPNGAAASFDDAFGLDATPAPVVSQPTIVEPPAPTASPFSMLPPPPSAKDARAKTESEDSPFSTARFPALKLVDRPASTAELDAAFGGTPAPPATAANGDPKPFAFEQSFDDAFDFGSAAPAQLAAPAAPATNGHASVAQATSSAWPTVPATASPAPVALPTPAPGPAPALPQRQPAYSPPSGPPPPQISGDSNYRPMNFDEAFDAPAETPVLNELPPPTRYAPPSSLAAPSPRTPQTVRAPTSDDEEDNRPLSQSIDRRRSISPPALRSRMSISPPPTSRSGKSSNNKDDGASKSKLSLHFPFGKNKNKNKDKAGTGSSKKSGVTLPDSPTVDEYGSYRGQQPPPSAPSQRPSRVAQAGPVTQDVIGSAGPDDDIAAVRTLVGMGFSRQQAVDALEQNSYDVPAALNKLLGAA